MPDTDVFHDSDGRAYANRVEHAVRVPEQDTLPKAKAALHAIRYGDTVDVGQPNADDHGHAHADTVAHAAAIINTVRDRTWRDAYAEGHTVAHDSGYRGRDADLIALGYARGATDTPQHGRTD